MAAPPLAIPVVTTAAYPVDATVGDSVAEAEKPPKKKRRIKALISIILLSLALATAGGFLAYYLIQLDKAQSRIEEQDREIEEQKNIIDKKETFGAAMSALMDTAAKFDGVLVADMVPFHRYEVYAAQGWAHRWKASTMDRHIDEVQTATTELEGLLAAATAEASANVTGTIYETITDQLGAGYVSSVIDDADTLCEDDVIACVVSDNPHVVHFDAGDNALPYMTDWLKTGVAYHEFAHVMQDTNPEPTETALASFDGDVETMADCFALTYLDGWKLDHRVWVSSYMYWDVSIGYGYTCNETQRQVIRDWYGQLGFHIQPISQ